jgi:invasion protein IalB
VQTAPGAVDASAALAASTNSAPAAPSASVTTPATTTKEVADLTDRKMRSQGYKPEVQNGKTVYCRKRTESGSHFESKSCATSEQVLRAQQAGKDALDEMLRTERGISVGPENRMPNR